MASSSVIARRYFEALAGADLDAAVACWAPGGVHRFAGGEEVTGPEAVRELLAELFAAFPDLRFEVLDTTTQRERCVVRWLLHGTFAGPSRFRGLAPNGARIELAGCHALHVEDDLIARGEIYLDGAAFSRQLGVLPAEGSPGDLNLVRRANARTRFGQMLHGAEPEAIAPGVWVLRGGLGHSTNAYLLEDEGGVTLYDAGVAAMGQALATAGVQLGGIRRVVLSHADCDHRGGAAGLRAPVYCHPLERSATASPSPFRDYWDLGRLSPLGRMAFARLAPRRDGGPLEVAGTVAEGEQLAGFRVIDLPGHAPGLIGLFREEDRLALVSDCVATVDTETGRRCQARVSNPALNFDTDQARESIRKLAELQPSVVWVGHGDPVSGEDVELQLQRAATAQV